MHGDLRAVDPQSTYEILPRRNEIADVHSRDERGGEEGVALRAWAALRFTAASSAGCGHAPKLGVSECNAAANCFRCRIGVLSGASTRAWEDRVLPARSSSACVGVVVSLVAGPMLKRAACPSAR